MEGGRFYWFLIIWLATELKVFVLLGGFIPVASVMIIIGNTTNFTNAWTRTFTQVQNSAFLEICGHLFFCLFE